MGVGGHAVVVTVVAKEMLKVNEQTVMGTMGRFRGNVFRLELSPAPPPNFIFRATFTIYYARHITYAHAPPRYDTRR